MSGSDVGARQAAPRPADLGAWYLAGGAGADPACLPEEELAALGEGSTTEVAPAEREHLSGCPRCASLLAAYRGVHVAKTMPDSWYVLLEGLAPPRPAERDRFPYQALGRVNLERLRFEPCDEDAWQEKPNCIRVNLVVDPEVDLFDLTLLEVPERFERVSVKTPRGWESLEKSEPEGTYQISRALFGYLVEEGQATYPLESLLDYVAAGVLEVTFRDACACREGDVDADAGGDDDASLLTALGAVESGFDYELPSGIHTDRFVNVGKLCHAEGSLHAVAAVFNALFRDVAFDVVVTNGWAMATIGRRLAALRSAHAESGPIADVMFEGYSRPVPVEDVRPGSRVLLLVDVVVTGGLVRGLEEAVKAAGAEVVARGCLLDPGCRLGGPHPGLRALCRLRLRLQKPGECPRCGVLERRAFNPFASCMTARAPGARSPSEFLQYDGNALAFWEKVNEADAYEYHRVEGDSHYTAFVDTAKLLKHPEVGPAVVEQLRDLLAEHHVAPGAILAPNRLRAKLLARALAIAFGAGRSEVPVLVASRRASRWQLPPGDEEKLASRAVLLLDSAAGHGKTLDLLALLASRARARSVSAAVLLSRLTDGCERAFSARLDGGFYSLFRLPIRPVVIHGTSRELCPFCQRRAAVHDAALDSRLEAIRRLDAWLSRAGRPARPPARPTEEVPREEQQTLFPPEPPSFLETCSRKVASGVALHSLYAAMTNGMAAMKLPELTNEAIPHENRAAMLEHLPPGVVEWSRAALEQDLERCLATVKNRSVWQATADVLARERQSRWIYYLDSFLTRVARQNKAPARTFWNSMVCDAYLVACRDPELGREMREQLERLLEAYRGTTIAIGLEQMLDAVR